MNTESKLVTQLTNVMSNHKSIGHQISFWRQSQEFVDELAYYLKNRKVLEVCAGAGLMAKQLSDRGVSITATSLFRGYDGHSKQMYFNVIEMTSIDAVEQYGSTHDVLLIIWPETGENALNTALQFFSSPGGDQKQMIFVGERTVLEKGLLGGCASDRFFTVFSQPSHVFGSYKGNSLEVAEVHDSPFWEMDKK